jgi:hypothetical protein
MGVADSPLTFFAKADFFNVGATVADSTSPTVSISRGSSSCALTAALALGSEFTLGDLCAEVAGGVTAFRLGVALGEALARLDPDAGAGTDAAVSVWSGVGGGNVRGAGVVLASVSRDGS